MSEAKSRTAQPNQPQPPQIVVARTRSRIDRLYEFIFGKPRIGDLEEITGERKNNLVFETIVVGSKTPRESELREALCEILLLEQPPLPIWHWRRLLRRRGESLESKAKAIAQRWVDAGDPRAIAERVPFIALRVIAGSKKSAITALKRFILEEVAPVFTEPRAAQRRWVDFYERKLGGTPSPVVSILTRQPFDVAWATAQSRGWIRPGRPYGFKESPEAWRRYWVAMWDYELTDRTGEVPVPPSLEDLRP